MVRRFWFPFLVALAVVAVYAEVARLGFVVPDDDLHVQLNPWMRAPSWSGLAAIWSAPYFGLYIPVTYSVWLGEAALSTLDPRFFHCGNLLLHLVNGLLVFRLLRRFSLGARAAAVGAAVFCLHPLQVESVAWISGLKDLGAAFWGLLALDRFLAFTERERPRLNYLLSLAAFALALLSKPSSVALPLLAAILALGFQGAPSRRTLLALVPWLLLALPLARLTASLQPPVAGSFVPGWGDRVRVALDAMGFYLRQAVFPSTLSLDYGRTPQVVLAHPWQYVWSLPLLFLVRPRASHRMIWAVLFFFAALSPTLGLVPFAYQAFSTVADRYAYLALFGLAVLAALAVELRPRRPVMVALAAILVAFAARSQLRVADWESSTRLATATRAVNPDSPFAHNQLGIAAYERRDYATALSHFAHCTGSGLPRASFHANAGLAHLQLGQFGEARLAFDRALRLEPNEPTARVHLGLALEGLGDLPAAERALRRALETDPDALVALNELGVVLLKQNKNQPAREILRYAVQAFPDEPALRQNLARAERRLTRTD